MESVDPKRKPLRKCHSQAIADALIRQGWTLRHPFREREGDEPYEYLSQWDGPGEPPPCAENRFS
jgi:hypothetical protein